MRGRNDERATPMTLAEGRQPTPTSSSRVRRRHEPPEQSRGNLIRRAEQLRCLMPNNDKTEIAITDGHENASTEWSRDGVRQAVASAEQERNWRFVFLGADASAFEDGQRMGIGTAAQYEPDGDGVRVAYDALDSATSAYRGSVRRGVLDAELSIVRDLTKKKRGSGEASGST
jgi:hypothetical protein